MTEQELAELIKLTLQRHTSTLPTVDLMTEGGSVLFIEAEDGGMFFLEVKDA